MAVALKAMMKARHKAVERKKEERVQAVRVIGLPVTSNPT